MWSGPSCTGNWVIVLSLKWIKLTDEGQTEHAQTFLVSCVSLHCFLILVGQNFAAICIVKTRLSDAFPLFSHKNIVKQSRNGMSYYLFSSRAAVSLIFDLIGSWGHVRLMRHCQRRVTSRVWERCDAVMRVWRRIWKLSRVMIRWPIQPTSTKTLDLQCPKLMRWTS